MQKFPHSPKIKYLCLDIFGEDTQKQSSSIRMRIPTSQDTSVIQYYFIAVALIPLLYLRQFKLVQVWALTIATLSYRLQSSQVNTKLPAFTNRNLLCVLHGSGEGTISVHTAGALLGCLVHMKTKAPPQISLACLLPLLSQRNRINLN